MEVVTLYSKNSKNIQFMTIFYELLGEYKKKISMPYALMVNKIKSQALQRRNS